MHRKIREERNQGETMLRRALAAFVLAVLVGCAGDTPSSGTNEDQGSSWSADQSQLLDQFSWPDQGPTQPQLDQGASPWSDSYSGTGFGCASDADCFGLKCCSTPWGVKLCAATCTE
jgi:hypothetical protein